MNESYVESKKNVLETVYDEKKREVDGLRTAVRYGKFTKEQALEEYKRRVAESGVGSPDFEAWLSRR